MRAYREDVAHAIAWLSHGTCREHASTRTIELTEAILPHTTCHILFLPPSFIRPQGVLSIHVHRQIRSFVCSNASYARGSVTTLLMQYREDVQDNNGAVSYGGSTEANGGGDGGKVWAASF